MKKIIFALVAIATLLVSCNKEQPLNTSKYAPSLFKLEVTEIITNSETQEVQTNIKRIDATSGSQMTVSFAPNVKVNVKIIPTGEGFEGVYFYANDYIQFCDVQKVSELEYVLTPAQNYLERIAKIDPQKPVYGQAWNGGLPGYNNVCSATIKWAVSETNL